MQVTVTFRHIDSSQPLKLYAEEKTERLSKYLQEPVEVHWVLSVEKIRHMADATVVAGGIKIKAQEESPDLYSSIDMAVDKLEKQVRKHKEKIKHHKGGANELPGQAEAGAAIGEAAHGNPRIVDTEQVSVKSMSVEEASTRALGADNGFYLFVNSTTNNLNIVYKKPDGDLGLMETEIK